MRCPACVAAGKRSVVCVGPSATTCVGFSGYHDEDGTYHSHDPNMTNTLYRCDAGHEWGERSRRECPACGEWWKQ